MGLFDIFASKDKKTVSTYRNYKNKPFNVGLEIDNLSDQDILWVHNNVKENFDFSDFPKGMKPQPLSDSLFFCNSY